MYLGTNLQHLRKTSGAMTQEKLAEQIGVSRQTVSKWESGEAYPEITKLMDLCNIFHCKLDDLLRQDMASHASTYYPVRILRVSGFRWAQYAVISTHPEEDANARLDSWMLRAGLKDIPGYLPVRIGWRFPYVTAEQKNRFGLKGYVSACILPEGFDPEPDDIQLYTQETAEYAVMTVRDPFAAAFNKVPQAYHLILDYLSLNGFKKKHSEKIIPCFERIYEKDGTTYLDVFIHCDSGGKISDILTFT